MENYFVPTNLDLFSSPPQSNAFTRVWDEELVSLVPTDLTTTLDFFSPGYHNKVKSLSEIYLSIKLQLLKKNGEKYLETDKTQPRLLNNALNSLFKTARLFLNNSHVVSIENYHIRSYLEFILNYSTHTASQYSLQGYYPPNIISNLSAMSSNSKVFDLYGKLSLINSERLLVTNTSLNVKLDFNPLSIIIVEGSDSSNVKTESTLKVRYFKKYVLN